MADSKKDIFFLNLSDEKGMRGLLFEVSDLIISSRLKNHSNIISHYKVSKVESNSFSIRLYINALMNKEEFENFVLKNFSFLCYNHEVQKYLKLNVNYFE